MEELKKQLFLLILFVITIGVLVIIYKSDYFWNIARGFPLHTNSQNCTKLNDEICLAEDAGLRLNYYEASSLCRKRGMTLPSREDSWYIWINSENCQRAFASNLEIPQDKTSFINSVENREVFASSIANYCAQNSIIKFPRASQYKDGLFWLKDNAGEDKHYAINYSTGKIQAVPNMTKALGVRCVSKK